MTTKEKRILEDCSSKFNVVIRLRGKVPAHPQHRGQCALSFNANFFPVIQE
jgi:hypothetical protein